MSETFPRGHSVFALPLPLCASLAALFALAACSPRLQRGLVYVERDGRELVLDLAYPPTSAPASGYPAILLLHGGGWQIGRRGDLENLVRRVASRGFVAATAEYRLAPDHRFPAALHDAQCALRWLRARPDVDPERVAAGGVSAGAHLALLLGSVDESAGLEDRDCPSPGSSRASAVVNVAGPTDLRLPMDAIRSRVAGFLGPRAERMPEALRLASPVAHLNAGDAPILAFYNRDDRVVPYAQAEVLRDAARRAGVPFTLHTREEGGHAWWGAALMQTVPTITGFLHTTLQ